MNIRIEFKMPDKAGGLKEICKYLYDRFGPTSNDFDLEWDSGTLIFRFED